MLSINTLVKPLPLPVVPKVTEPALRLIVPPKEASKVAGLPLLPLTLTVPAVADSVPVPADATDITGVLIERLPLVTSQLVPSAKFNAVASLILNAAPNAPLLCVPDPPARVMPMAPAAACPAILMLVPFTTPLFVNVPPSARLNVIVPVDASFAPLSIDTLVSPVPDMPKLTELLFRLIVPPEASKVAGFPLLPLTLTVPGVADNVPVPADATDITGVLIERLPLVTSQFAPVARLSAMASLMLNAAPKPPAVAEPDPPANVIPLALPEPEYG